MSVLAAIAVLALLIVVHELGHFAAARFQGIRVNRFSIGFGPALAKYEGSETEYAIRALPLGGYVGFPDDDPDSEIPPDDPNLLRNRPIFDRAIVISAGVIANLIFAYFLLVGQAGILGVQDVQPGVIIRSVDDTSAARRGGLESGDLIVAVNGESLGDFPDSTENFIEKVKNAPSIPLDLMVKRGEDTLILSVTPQPNEAGEGKMGVGLLPNVSVRHAENLGDMFRLGATSFQNLTTLTVKGFWQLLSNFKETAQQVAGPVKIVEYGAAIADNGLANLLQFGALISINLAIINILPLPALDGGQLAFLLVEGLRGKPLPQRLQEGIMQTGLVLLLGLGFILIVRDTLNLAVFQ
ncbi:MAG: RIP metalloprotease RseP [Microcystaceae cyanobacterium]